MAVFANHALQDGAILIDDSTRCLVVFPDPLFPVKLRQLVLELQIFTKFMSYTAKQSECRDAIQTFVTEATLMNVSSPGVDQSF